jgi:flagellin-like protein
MRFTRRRAVSPIIATLLLIAISVSAGIIVYVFVNSLSGNLTQQGGQQVSDQLSMDAYSFPASSVTPVFILRNVGSSSVTITSVYYDGNLCQTTGFVCTGGSNNPAVTNAGGCSSSAALPTTCTAGQYVPVTLTLGAAPSSGTSHIIRVVTGDGGTFTFSIIAGRSG